MFLPHLYVYHMCTRALHMSSPVAIRSIVDLGATVQKNKNTTKAILVMHALSGADTVIATYNVGKQLARKAMGQPTQKSCPSLMTFKPILMKYAAQNDSTADLKLNQNYFDIDQDYLTLTRRYSKLLNTLDIDLVPSYSTRHMYFGSTGITSGP